MKTCETCGRQYPQPSDWIGSSTDDGLCGECRQAEAEHRRELEEQEAEMEHENPPIKCDYCGAPNGDIIVVDPIRGWLGWVLWTITAKFSCGKPGCYSRAKRDSETAVEGMCDVRII